MQGRPDPLRFVPAFVAICATLWVLVVSWLPGVPGFQHDWAWPFTRAQAFADAESALHIWHADGLGTSSSAPNAAAVGLILWCFAGVVGPLNALHLLDIAFVAIAASGAYYCAKSYEQSASGLVAAGIYCSSPVIYNKLFAGHIYYIIGIALLPWVTGFACRALKSEHRRLSYTMACGVAIAFAAGQLQFIAVCAIVILLVGLLAPVSLSARAVVAMVALGTALVLHAADYAVMLQPQSGSGFASQAATVSWQVSQSVPLLHAFAQYDYIGGYARSALGSHATAAEQTVAATLGLITVFAIFARRQAAILGILLVCGGGLISAGTYGPLAVPLAYEVSRNGFATVFRELYNFDILTSLGASLLAAQCVSTSNRIWRSAAALITCILIVALALPFVLRPPHKTMTAVSASHAAEIMRETQAHTGRTLLLPGGPALSYASSAFHGVDSDGQGCCGMIPVTYTAAADQYAYLFSDAATAQVLSRAGIVRTVARTDVRSEYFRYLDPYSASIAQRLIAHAPSHNSSGNLALPLEKANYTDVVLTNAVTVGVPTWSTLEHLPAGTHLVSEAPKAIVPVSSTVSVGVDPMHEWTQSTRWLPAIPQLACLPQPSLFKLHGNVIPVGCNWRLGQFHGTRCLTNTAGALEAISLSCVYPTVSPSGRTDIAPLTARVKQGASKLAFIRTSYDSRWSLRCGERPITAQPVLVDVYAMGWVIDGSTRCGQYRAEFSGDREFGIELCGSWVLVAIIWIFVLRRERRYSARS